jgi:hypothetical protein
VPDLEVNHPSLVNTLGNLDVGYFPAEHRPFRPSTERKHHSKELRTA